MNPPPNQPPRRGQTAGAIEHYIVACRSSALVLNAQGCPQEARELRDIANRAEQALGSSRDGRAGGVSTWPAR